MTVDAGLIAVALSAANPMTNSLASDVDLQFTRWEQQLRSRVAELHVQPQGADKNVVAAVEVTFSIGLDGRPADALIRKSSGEAIYDRAALRLVRRLGRLGQLPSASGKEHRIVLDLTYGEAPGAEADRELARRLERDRNSASRRNVEIVTARMRPMITASR